MALPFFSTTGKQIMKKQALGAVWSKEKTTFRVFAPSASEVTLRIYERGEDSPAVLTVPMEREDVFFHATLQGDFDGKYYTYEVNGEEVVDPYAKSAGVNGKRGFIFDPATTNPEGWENDCFEPKMPIIWEVHVRDFSSDYSLSVQNKGKYAAFQTGVKTPAGRTALIDYLKELGVTYVHLLPVMDMKSVDEKNPDDYNWGYDPASYFYPEGSYSLNPYDGRMRVKELKTLIKTLHENGIGVILDAVYNHVYKVETSNLQLLAPNCYFRMDGEKFRNGSGCGNETASERTPMRNLMLDSTRYWVEEYHVDGFRFDLMGLHDVQTMNRIRESIDALPGGKDVLMYGEPWYCECPRGIFPADLSHIHLLNDRIAIFNPELRDGIRGAHFGNSRPGYLQGNMESLRKIKAWIAGGTCINEFGGGFRIKPSQQIAYCASHDDYTLFDQLMNTTWPGFDGVRAHKMSAFILLSCLGIPFFQAGEEFLRTKGGWKNSYNAGDRVNHLDWKRRDYFDGVVRYYRGLIAIRKSNKAFLSPNCADFAWIPSSNPDAAAYAIGDYIYCFNNSEAETKIDLSKYGKLLWLADIDRTDLSEETEGSVIVPAHNVFLAKMIR